MTFHKTTKAVVRGNLLQTALQSKRRLPEDSDPELAAEVRQRISTARRKLALIIFIPILAALVILGGYYYWSMTAEPGLALEGRQLLAIPAEASLTQETAVGDVLRLYGGGAEIPSMQYVEVAAVSDSSVSILLTSRQTRDYLDAAGDGPVLAALVIHGDPEAAAEALALQERWNNPSVALGFPEELLVLEPEETADLELELSMDPEDAVQPAVTYSSSDETVAAVDGDGTVTAVSSGEAVITARCGEAEASRTVLVVLPATELSFNSKEISIGVGGNAALEPAASPEDYTEPLTWESSDPEVATVDGDGTVTGISRGEAEITASGLHASASYTVRVITEASGVSLSRETLALEVGETGALAAVVTPEDASDKTVTWTSSDESIATVDARGVVTGIAQGEAEITAACGAVSAVCAVTVTASPENWNPAG